MSRRVARHFSRHDKLIFKMTFKATIPHLGALDLTADGGGMASKSSLLNRLAGEIQEGGRRPGLSSSAGRLPT
jgi:hypothetical protein